MVHVKLKIAARFKASNTDWALKSIERVDVIGGAAMCTARAHQPGTDWIEVRPVDVLLEGSRIVGGVWTHQTHQRRRNRRNRYFRLVVGLQLQSQLTTQGRAFAMILLRAIHDNATVHIFIITVHIVTIIVIIHYIVVRENHGFGFAAGGGAVETAGGTVETAGAAIGDDSVAYLRAGSSVMRFTLHRRYRWILISVLLLTGASVFHTTRRNRIMTADDSWNFRDRW